MEFLATLTQTEREGGEKTERWRGKDGEKTERRRGKEEKNGRHLIYTHARERGEGIYIRSIYIGEREETGYSRNGDREETGRG